VATRNNNLSDRYERRTLGRFLNIDDNWNGLEFVTVIANKINLQLLFQYGQFLYHRNRLEYVTIFCKQKILESSPHRDCMGMDNVKSPAGGVFFLIWGLKNPNIVAGPQILHTQRPTAPALYCNIRGCKYYFFYCTYVLIKINFVE